MKRLLALLLLLSSAALTAQQLDWTNAVNVPNIVVNPSMNDCVAGAPTCGAWKESGSPLGNWVGANSNGGAFDPGGKQYTFSYMPGMLYQDIDLSLYDTNLFNFTFSFDLNNSCRNFIGGACDRIDGPIDPFSVTLKFYDTNGLNNSFTFLSGNPSTANIGCVGGLQILGLCLLGQNVQDNWQSFGWYSHVQSDGLFTSARLEFTGNDAGFWGGLYGPSVDNPMLQINYMPPPLPTSGGLAGMNVSAPGSDYIFIYKGNDPILFSQLATKGEDLVGWTAVSAGGEALKITSIERPESDYLFLYTEGIPTSGTYYSFQEQPPTVDCALEPFDPTCVINTLGIGEEPVMFADEETGSDDGSVDGTEIIEEEDATVEEEMLADADIIEEETLEEETAADEESLEEMLAEESEEEEEVVAEERILVYRELSDEEKSKILEDSISKNTLEAALSVAADAVSSATAVSSTTAAAVSSESSSRSTTSTVAGTNESAVTTTETVVSVEVQSETTKDESVDSSALAALEILDTGRQLGQEALATTLASSESSANDSIAEAQSIASTSSGDTQSSGGSADVLIASTTAETNPTDTSNQTVEQIETETATTEQFVAEAEQSTETIMQTQEAPSAVDSTGAEQSLEVFASNISPAAVAAEQEELENSIVQQAIAASQTNEEENKMGFAEAEAVTIASDPALVNAFNMQPNTASLELLGVLGSRAEEKSDAELRAEQVVAANKEQQDAINANYMEADQSGILAAIGSETDVTSYRTAMIRDNNNWYKPEDIYKGVIIKDNVRGSYFLEKGNTDTYKKMIEEQYK